MYCARAGQEIDGLCFLPRFFYKKVQESADRVYLRPVALEAIILQIYMLWNTHATISYEDEINGLNSYYEVL